MTVRMQNVTVELDGRLILKDFSFTLPEQGIIALSGPSGCGKSTLLRTLAGLTRLKSGQIKGIADKKVVLLFQEDRLLPWLTVFDNINLVVRQNDLTTLWLQRMQLTNQAQSLPAQLSGGMKRRVALARALALDSDLLLLDEPFQGMDETLKDHLFPWILAAGQKKPVLMITHNKDELLQSGNRIILSDGPPLKIFTGL